MEQKQLTARLIQLKQKLENEQAPTDQDKIKIFISVGYVNTRAVVFTGVGNSFKTAFKSAQDKAVKYAKEQDADPDWLMADLVTNEYVLSPAEWEELASKTKRFYFSYGFSLDKAYNTAFLQQEINGSCLIKYTRQRKKWEGNEKIDQLVDISRDKNPTDMAELNVSNINYHLKNVRKQNKRIETKDIKEFILFDTISYFEDNSNCYPMSEDKLSLAHRKIDTITPEFLFDMLRRNSSYLAKTVGADGRFIYGYFSCFNKEIESYNSIRHALGVYGLADTYLVTKDESLLLPIERSLRYLLEELTYTVDDYCFIVDRENNNEIRLGAMSVAILAITRSMEIFGEKAEYLEILKKLGSAILYMQNPATGNFTHVIGYPDLKLVEEFRIVYYSGEAAFALMRLYRVDKDDKWLKAVHKAFDYFIDNKYWKYADHWLAYCTNELTAISPEDRYFEFGLKNAFYKIDFIIDRITTWPTFLEMLTAAHSMINNIKTLKKDYLFAEFDLNLIETALDVRAKRQLDGVFFPETAMYFKSPETILYGVFIRHHSFRVRNDDVAHHLSGYCEYYKTLIGKDD